MWSFLEEIKYLFTPGKDIADVILQSREPNYQDNYVPRPSGGLYNSTRIEAYYDNSGSSYDPYFGISDFFPYQHPVLMTNTSNPPKPYHVCKYCGQLNKLENLHCEYCGGRLV